MIKNVLNKSVKIIIISFLILFSLINLAGLKFKTFGRSLLALNDSKYYFGDLYELSRLWRFKDNIFVDTTPYKNPDVQEAKVITLGDSFFESNLETMRLPHLLSFESGKKVHHVERNEFLKYNDNPIEYLRKSGYTKTSEKKYLVLETTERYALERSSTIVESIFAASVENPSSPPIKTALSLSSKTKNLIDASTLQYLFYNNKLISPLKDLGKNFRFELFKEIDWRTPKYSKNPEMLFYLEDINFSGLDITDETIGIYANNIKLIRDYLIKEYNLELIYVVIPTKYSIYGEHVENSKAYNNFIPRAVKEMKKYNINTFDSYTLYKDTLKNSSDLLYFKGDSHFTSKGKDLILKEIKKLIK